MTSNSFDSEKRNVDTNADEHRTTRGLRQFELEKNLHQFNGLSYVERFFLVRDTIFAGMNNIMGTSLNTLISNAEVRGRISRELVANDYLPAFVKYVDTREEKLASLSTEAQAESGFRFAMLVYLLSLTIHQSIDGNTQSANIITLSYIRQFCPDYRNNFIPIKYKDLDITTNYLKVPFLVFESTLSPDMTEKDETLRKQISEIRKLTRLIENDPQNINLMRVDYDEFQKLASEKLRVLIDNIKNEFGFIFSKAIDTKLNDNDYGMVALNACKEIAAFLNKKYPGYTVSSWGFASDKDDRIAQQKHLLTVTLLEPRGNDFLDLYLQIGGETLLTQPQEISENNQKALSYIAIVKALMHYETEFKRVLDSENEAQHQSDHDAALQ